MTEKLDKNKNIIGIVHVDVKHQKKEDGGKFDVVLDILLAIILAFQILIIVFMACDMMGIWKQDPGYDSPENEIHFAGPFTQCVVNGFGMEFYLLSLIQIIGTAILLRKRFKMCRAKPKEPSHSLFLIKGNKNFGDRIANKLRKLRERISAAHGQAKSDIFKDIP